MADCNRCGKEIQWMKLASGKSHPVDPEPIMIETSGSPMEGYKSHFATCDSMPKKDDGPPNW